MAKRIIVLSDGTGNSAAAVWRTNVWRTFEALDLTPSSQIAFYDDGVGTSSFKPLAILGGGFGYGLKRNVIDLYKFLCRNYKSAEENRDIDKGASDDDEIFAFGFSRGAFTIRVLVGLVLDQGLVKADTEAQLDSLAIEAYRNYRSSQFHTKFGIEKPFRAIRDWVLRRKPGSSIQGARRVSKIRFLGLWDTVAAYGLPVDEMTRGISRYLWPLELPDHALDPKRIGRACHAVSLDDQRTTFHPILWDESNLPAPPDPLPNPYLTSSEKVTQIWFSGVHSNVGGGYPDDSLAHIPMVWIWKEAKDCGLVFKASPTADPDAFLSARSKEDKDGRLYDSRSGLGGYYRYGPRSVDALCNVQLPDLRDCVLIKRPKIHDSVFKRLALGAHSYAPVGLPPVYDVVTYNATTQNHEILSATAPFRETPDDAVARHADQERIVWSTVWRGRGIYFLTVLASIYLAIYPLAAPVAKTAETTTRLRFISDTIRLIAIPLPAAANRWVDAYAGDPALFLVSVITLATLLGLSAGLRARITDQMRKLLATSLQMPNNPRQSASVPDEWRPGGWFDFLAVFLMIAAVIVGLIINPFSLQPSWLWPSLGALLGKISWFVGFLALIALVVLFTPSPTVFSLRSSPTYKHALQSLRLRWAPLFFAVLFSGLGVVFMNHYMFNIRDGFGAFCVGTIKNGQALTEKNGGIANVCFESNTGNCLASATNDETGVCEDATGKKCTGRYQIVDTRDLCTRTGIYLNKNQRYQLFVRKATADEAASYQSTHPGFQASKSEWRFAWTSSDPGGKTFSALGRLDENSCGQQQAWNSFGAVAPMARKVCNYLAAKARQAFAIVVYPLKRTFDRPLGRFVLRYGATGNEENPIDPDIPPQEGGKLDEIFKPTRDGELFVYLNKPVFGFWAEASHNLNSGLARVKVVRIPPKN
jgi:uncharacterized protein (DUF2235 family)